MIFSFSSQTGKERQVVTVDDVQGSKLLLLYYFEKEGTKRTINNFKYIKFSALQRVLCRTLSFFSLLLPLHCLWRCCGVFLVVCVWWRSRSTLQLFLLLFRQGFAVLRVPSLGCFFYVSSSSSAVVAPSPFVCFSFTSPRSVTLLLRLLLLSLSSSFGQVFRAFYPVSHLHRMLFFRHKLSLPFHFFLIIGVFFLGEGGCIARFSLSSYQAFFVLFFFLVILFWCVFVSGAGSCVCVCFWFGEGRTRLDFKL